MTPGQLFPCPGQTDYMLGQRFAPVIPPQGGVSYAAPQEGGGLGWWGRPRTPRGRTPDRGPWVSFDSLGQARMSPDGPRTVTGVEFSGGGRPTGYLLYQLVWNNVCPLIHPQARDPIWQGRWNPLCLQEHGPPQPPTAARGLVRIRPTLITQADTVEAELGYADPHATDSRPGRHRAFPQVRLVYAPTTRVPKVRRPGRPARLPQAPRYVPRRRGGMNGPPDGGLGQGEAAAEPFLAVAVPLLIGGAVLGYAFCAASKGSKK